MKPTVCLCMIVKNEAHVISRCLESVRDLLSYWVIVDTGSTDDTAGVIHRELGTVPGELHHRPWVDFGHNRSEALRLARGKADYVLIIDADEVLLRGDGFALPASGCDSYTARHHNQGCDVSFELPNLVRGDLPWRYEGVLHEYIVCEQASTEEVWPGATICGHFDSARNRHADKYRRDADVLERALEREPDNARYAFYLAQSYRDAGDVEQAIAAYERRAEMGGWWEEVWYSLYQIAWLKEVDGASADELIAAYQRAHVHQPHRAEPLCELARLHRERGDFQKAWSCALAATRLPVPADRLFVDVSAYERRSWDELAVAAGVLGNLDVAIDAARRVLACSNVPPEDRERVEENLETFLETQRGDGTLDSAA